VKEADYEKLLQFIARQGEGFTTYPWPADKAELHRACKELFRRGLLTKLHERVGDLSFTTWQVCVNPLCAVCQKVPGVELVPIQNLPNEYAPACRKCSDAVGDFIPERYAHLYVPEEPSEYSLR
jgi:hypothetical protein